MADLSKGITWSEGMRVGWLLFWRGLLLSFVCGFVVGFFGGLTGVPQYAYIVAAGLISPLLVWPVVVSQMLSKRFRGFSLQIVRDSN